MVMMKLPFGKISADILKDVVFKNLGIKREEVILGPSAGFDGAVIEVSDKSIIASMDPITGAIERIGWLAVNINANDVATFGVEVTPGLVNPIVVGCMLGVTEKGKYVTAGGAKPGDKLILTKSAGIEGTAILASDKEKILKNVIDAKTLQNAKRLYNQISVVKDAITAYKTGGVNAMHDPTEGGIAGGIHEMADASNLGVKVLEEKIHVQPETQKICKFFKIDPLQLISSGALLISAKPKFTEKIIRQLRKENIPASVIGQFLENPRKRQLLTRDGQTKNLPRPITNHLWVALQEEVPSEYV
jgi:hydrogenase expression/formation protein HypE